MPLYFFNASTDDAEHADEGTELRDVAEARQQAIKTTAAMVMEEMDTSLGRGERVTMTVTDAKNVVVCAVKFSIRDY